MYYIAHYAYYMICTVKLMLKSLFSMCYRTAASSVTVLATVKEGLW